MSEEHKASNEEPTKEDSELLELEKELKDTISHVVRLTQYSHGAGCGCKISPQILEHILQSKLDKIEDPHLLVGNENKDDAAVYDIGNGVGIISTTDFFMPIVDDPFEFGQIAAANAISDVYAMGGKPLMAIAILGFPLNLLPAEVAQRIVDGGRSICQQAGISLAGGHSIDAPEPIFGLAVTGIVSTDNIKTNHHAQVGCELYLTKPLGIGILTTAEKKGKLKSKHQGLASQVMRQLNSIGADFAHVEGITAMTDVTGFGLLGHLIELCQGSHVSAKIEMENITTLEGVDTYIEKGCIPGGTERNFNSYGHLVSSLTEKQKAILCDPQTSGGLLIAVKPTALAQIKQIAQAHHVELIHVGTVLPPVSERATLIEVV